MRLPDSFSGLQPQPRLCSSHTHSVREGSQPPFAQRPSKTSFAVDSTIHLCWYSGSGTGYLPWVTWVVSASLGLEPESLDSRPDYCDPDVTNSSLIPNSSPGTAEPSPH